MTSSGVIAAEPPFVSAPPASAGITATWSPSSTTVSMPSSSWISRLLT